MNKTQPYGSLSAYPVTVHYDISTTVEPEQYFAVNYNTMEVVEIGQCLHHAQAVLRTGEIKEQTQQDVRSCMSAKEWKELAARNPCMPIPYNETMRLYDIVWDSLRNRPRFVLQTFPPSTRQH